MSISKLRRQIAHTAARMIAQRQEPDIHKAKFRAARQLVRGWVPEADLPSPQEIRAELNAIARIEAETRAFAEQFADAEESSVDRFVLYESLLAPLEHVKQSPKSHPEGDALYHSLQVYELGKDELPWDEEFLSAALLHDVGKAIDPLDHVAAGLAALEGHVTERTAWLIEHHHAARGYLDGTLGLRARRRLERSESFEEVKLLARCDFAGRQPGFPVSELSEALDYLRELDSGAAWDAL